MLVSLLLQAVVGTDSLVARGMTRASFGMPDTSRAARYILKDYVNAKLLYAHAPPGIDADQYMSTSRAKTLAQLDAEYSAGRKRAPVTHVGKNADTFVAPAGANPASEMPDIVATNADVAAESTIKQRQLTSQSVRANAASAPGRTGRQKADALDGVFFAESGPAPRPVVKGRRNDGTIDVQEGGLGFSRDMQYPHQRMLGPDGRPLAPNQYAALGRRLQGDKKHFKGREGKKRSGAGYD